MSIIWKNREIKFLIKPSFLYWSPAIFCWVQLHIKLDEHGHNRHQPHHAPIMLSYGFFPFERMNRQFDDFHPILLLGRNHLNLLLFLRQNPFLKFWELSQNFVWDQLYNFRCYYPWTFYCQNVCPILNKRLFASFVFYPFMDSFTNFILVRSIDKCRIIKTHLTNSYALTWTHSLDSHVACIIESTQNHRWILLMSHSIAL